MCARATNGTSDTVMELRFMHIGSPHDLISLCSLAVKHLLPGYIRARCCSPDFFFFPSLVTHITQKQERLVFCTCNSHAHFLEPSLQLSLAAEPPPGLRRGLRGAQEAITARLSANIETLRRRGRGFLLSFHLVWTSDYFSCRG